MAGCAHADKREPMQIEIAGRSSLIAVFIVMELFLER